MNNSINIAERLKDCLKGMKLYSPLFGEVTFGGIDPACSAPIKVKYNTNNYANFGKTGLYYDCEGAECLLFPSSEMRDWGKFFKRGDVLYSTDNGMQAVFKGWLSDDFTSFDASIVHYVEVDEWDEDIEFAVASFCKASEEATKDFIFKAEKHYNGKYNPETLQVEPVKFKPFDKVLVRDTDEQAWCANYFSHYKNDPDYFYVCINGSYHYCIPYNEHTAHLLGVTDPYTEGVR